MSTSNEAWTKLAHAIICISFLLSCRGVSATELTDLSLDELLGLEVSIASKRLEHFSEAPSVVTVISREQITRCNNSFNLRVECFHGMKSFMTTATRHRHIE